MQVSKLQDLVYRSKTARCRGRFVCPVILFKGKVRSHHSLAFPETLFWGNQLNAKCRVFLFLVFAPWVLGGYWVPGGVRSRPQRNRPVLIPPSRMSLSKEGMFTLVYPTLCSRARLPKFKSWVCYLLPVQGLSFHLYKMGTVIMPASKVYGID